jgi:hypothetical protein
MNSDIGAKQIVHSRVSQSRFVSGGNNAVSVQTPKHGMMHERLQVELVQFADANGREWPIGCDFLYLFEQRVGVAQMARELEKIRQMAQHEVRRPIRFRTARLGAGNAAGDINLFFGNVAADNKAAKLMKQTCCPKRCRGRKSREFQREFVASESVQLFEHR